MLEYLGNEMLYYNSVHKIVQIIEMTGNIFVRTGATSCTFQKTI